MALNGVYLDPVTVDRLDRRKRKQKGWGIGLTIFSLLGVYWSLTAKEGEAMYGDLPFYLGWLAASLIPLVLGIRNQLLLTTVLRCNAVFETDLSGVVGMGELQRQTRQSEGLLLARLHRAFDKGVFVNCSLDYSGERPCVKLAEETMEQRRLERSFLHVKCACCGGTSRLRRGTVGKCDYCGSPIRGE